MDCNSVGQVVFRKLDGELSPAEDEQLNAHLATCPSCLREFRLLTLTQFVGQAAPAPEPSPYFYQKLKARIDSEARISIWQLILGLSRRVVPTMAAVTLALLSAFFYFQLRSPGVDFYQAYEGIFNSAERQSPMVIADQTEITDESVLFAIAERGSSLPPEMSNQQK